jgi:hypothetical protein
MRGADELVKSLERNEVPSARGRKRNDCGVLIADEGGFACLDERKRPAGIAFADLQSHRPPGDFIKKNGNAGLIRRNGAQEAQGRPCDLFSGS